MTLGSAIEAESDDDVKPLPDSMKKARIQQYQKLVNCNKMILSYYIFATGWRRKLHKHSKAAAIFERPITTLERGEEG